MAKPVYLALFFLSAVLLYSVGNWSLPLIDRDEPRFAEASREMRQSADFLIPRLNGEYRFDKPPLIYWCQVLAFDVFGENDFAARFPSAIFAALTAAATWIFASRIFGPHVGVWSGLILATCLQVFIHARAAVADMPLVFFFLTATWADWEKLRNPRSAIWWWTFYLSLGLGFLAKGPAALLPIFFAPVQSFLNCSRFRFKFRSALLGGFVVLSMIGAWGIPAVIATNGEYLRNGLGKHVLERSLQPMETHGGEGFAGYLFFLPFYLVASFFSFFPWCFFLPACMKRLLAAREPDENYLLGPILIVVLVFTLIETKLPHYVLPAYPMLATLVARQVSESKWRLSILASVVVLYLFIALVGFRIIEPEFPSKRIAKTALPLISPETRTASLNYDEQSLIWYLRQKTRLFHRRLDSSNFSDFMNQPGSALCVVNQESIGKIHLNPDWKIFEVSGYNFARWKIASVPFSGIRIPLPVPQPIDLVTIVKT
ncbi:MAG: glycosyltransferase family 39 protein [Verrucomicrobia bacterium]|nr:glycosyltransferase family 39 protein [Verrucomicrobiota bacterium]